MLNSDLPQRRRQTCGNGSAVSPERRHVTLLRHVILSLWVPCLRLSITDSIGFTNAAPDFLSLSLFPIVLWCPSLDIPVKCCSNFLVRTSVRFVAFWTVTALGKIKWKTEGGTVLSEFFDIRLYSLHMHTKCLKVAEISQSSFLNGLWICHCTCHEVFRSYMRCEPTLYLLHLVT